MAFCLAKKIGGDPQPLTSTGMLLQVDSNPKWDPDLQSLAEEACNIDDSRLGVHILGHAKQPLFFYSGEHFLYISLLFFRNPLI